MRLLRALEADGRYATPEEQSVLARWSGWGALPKVFDEADEQWADIREELRSLLGDDAEAWGEAKRSVLNAHYSDPRVVMAMWDAVRGLGLETGSVLEPGCGSGNFFAYAPDGVQLVGVERDRTTAAIAGALYPDAAVLAVPFEAFDAHTPFDAAIGNVPFAQVTPTDPRYNRGSLTLHNYFLAKSLQLVRPGGIVMALSSLYTLDARNPAARRTLAQHADLVGAVRLPNRSMYKIAGTDVIQDILILRRRPDGAPPAGADGWDRTVEIEAPDESTGATNLVRVNRYFADNPAHVLGTTVSGHGIYRDGEMMVRGDLASLGDRVQAALAAIVERTELRYEPAFASRADPPRRRLVGDTEVQGDRLTPLRHGNFVVSRTGVLYLLRHGELVPAPVPKGSGQEVRALVHLRDRVVDQLRLEADDAPEAEIEANRQRLVIGYEDYVRGWGPLNRVAWHRTGRADPVTGEDVRRRAHPRMGGFRDDPEWAVLSSIEDYDEETGVAAPAAILQERTVHPPLVRLGAETADEALAISLDEHGRVDLGRVAELLGVDEETARAEIDPRVFEDPRTAELVPAEMYLSGNVRQKLAEATRAAAADGLFARHVEALGPVQPAQVGAKDIVVRPGAPWVSTRDIEAFACEVLGGYRAKVSFTPSIGAWDVDAPGADRYESRWGTPRMSPEALLEASLNQRLVRVYDTHDERRVLNVTDTAAAREKQEEIAERFSRWVWEDDSRTARLVETYNARFNSYVPPDYGGDHLTLPGLASTFVPHSHQRAAVARIIREGRALLGHAVGAGKTATMVIAGMELRRLGLVNRPAYVVPNHMLEQFSRELLQLYPQARVLSVTKDMTGREGRRKFVARAATGEWDAVVITHSAFERMPLRTRTVERYVAEQTQAMRDDLESAQSTLDDVSGDAKRKSRSTVKKLEARVAQQEARLAALIDAASKDAGVCWEETGIDFLMIDELHLFKNRTIVTAVEGVGHRGSKRASDLDAKLWYLRQARGNRVLVGATATPIANSIAEAWVMQTYVQPDVLAEAQLDRFDAWAATFGQVVSAVELAPDGGSYRVSSRLARFQNVPELVGQFRRTADVKARADLDLKLPQLRGGGPQVVVVSASDDLTDYVGTLVDRAEVIRNKGVEPDVDNMLKVTGDGRAAALDMRLVGGRPDPEGGKLAVVADRIARIYRDTRDNAYVDTGGEPSPRRGGFQIVFCDLATPGGGRAWNAYDQLKENLVAAGVPSDEVAFIHDPNNDDTRARLFAKCRNGQVAVLVGSTQKMGVGTNIHTRAVALHHIDCPWRPADIEQREGRIIRQGNQNDEVQILRYATEGSFDVYMWQTVERKAGFIDQVMRGEAVGRDVDDVGDAVLSFAEVKALASGNPLIIELAGVQADKAKYERLEQAHREEQANLQSKADGARRGLVRAEQTADDYRSAIERRIDTSGDRFTMRIEDQAFTSRADANAALRDIVSESFQSLRDRTDRHRQLPERCIGEVGGFEVHLAGYALADNEVVTLAVRFGDRAEREIRVTPEDAETLTTKLVERIERPIRRLEAELKLADQHLAELKDDIRHIEERIGEPFAHRDHLTHLRHRHQAITDELEAQAESDATAADRRSATPSENPADAPKPIDQPSTDNHDASPPPPSL